MARFKAPQPLNLGATFIIGSVLFWDSVGKGAKTRHKTRYGKQAFKGANGFKLEKAAEVRQTVGKHLLSFASVLHDCLFLQSSHRPQRRFGLPNGWC